MSERRGVGAGDAEEVTAVSERINAPVNLDDIQKSILVIDDDDGIQSQVVQALLNTTAAPSPQSVFTLENLDLLTESSDIAYFYLKNEIGMSEEAMWKITLEAGSALGMTAHTLRRKVDLLRRTMDLSDGDVQTLLARQPTILHLSADKNLAPTILFLVRALDLSKEDLRTMIVQFPCILSYSKKNLSLKLRFFRELMKYSAEECRALFVDEPKLLTAGVRTGLLPHLRFFLRDVDIPLINLRTIIQKNPLLMLYSLEENLVPKLIFYLTTNLRVDSKQLVRLLTAYPQMLDFNLDNHILPITAYMMQELGFSPIEFRQIILKFPRLVTHSLFKIKHVVGYLQYELGMEASQVKRVIYQAPQVIGLSMEGNVQQKVSFIRDSFQLTDQELRRVLSGMPTLLCCNVDSNLRPKTEYLLQVFGSVDDLREAVLKLPAVLGFSLEKRIRPRMERLLEIGAHPRGITIGIPMKDEAFEAWINRRQKRLEKNPGFDNKGKEDNVDKVALVVVRKTEQQPRDGRIVHWTRERQPPSPQ
jgi:mTERF domain-containing protein